MEQVIKKIAFTVSLVNGESRTHAYDVPSTKAETKKFFDDELSLIFGAMTRGKSVALYFANPNTFYNPDNVLSVSITGITAGDIEKAIKSAQEKVGFVK